jgi:hypothetical protein
MDIEKENVEKVKTVKCDIRGRATIGSEYAKEKVVIAVAPLNDGQRYTNGQASSYVYAMKDADNMVKIGRSRSPENRLEQLKSGSNQDLELLKVVEEPSDENYESRLHDEFSHCRDYGEWFDMFQADISRLCELMDELEG